MNENMKYLEILNTLKKEIPEIKETISTIQNHLTEANNLFQPFWVKLSETQDKLDLSENKMKILENDINKSKSEIVEMRNVSESLSEQNRNLSIKVDELIPQLESPQSNLSTLHQKMAETEERVIASIKKQKELIDTVDELLIKVNDTGLSVDGANKKLSNITSQMERNQPMFDNMEKTFIQAQEIKSTFEDIQQHTRGTERRIFNLHGSITHTKSRFTKLSNNVKTVEHHLAAVDDKHTQLVTRQVELDDNMEKSKNDIINLDDQLTKAKGEVADFNGKLASTKEDMTQRLDKLSGDIAKAESEMSSIKTESEGYTNRINDLENRTNERIDKLYVRTEIEEQFTTYVKHTLPDVVSVLETIKGSGTYNIIIYYSSYYVYMEFFK
jgi:chromosome segregation ATPase